MKSSNEAIRMRRENIVDYILEVGQVSMDSLSEKFGVSVLTIRRDLLYLVEKHLVKKNEYNQYIAYEDVALIIGYDQRMRTNLREKTAIANKALEFVKEGDFLGVDSSSTTLILCKMFTHMQNLSVVTTSQILPIMLENYNNITMMSTGGVALRGHASYVGPITLSTISMFHYDKVFLSTSALDANLGFGDVSEELNLKTKFIERADQSFVLCDSSKFGKRSMHYLFSVVNVSVIITDWKISDSELQKLEYRGYTVVVAPEPE